MERGGPRFSRPYRAHRGGANNYNGGHIFRNPSQRFSRGNTRFPQRGNHIRENFNGYRQNFPTGQFPIPTVQSKIARREYTDSQQKWNKNSDRYQYVQAGRTQHTQNIEDTSD